MEKMKNKGLIEREQKMSYKNFNVAVYCPVGNVNGYRIWKNSTGGSHFFIRM